MNKHIGSTLESLLDELGQTEAVNALTAAKIRGVAIRAELLAEAERLGIGSRYITGMDEVTAALGERDHMTRLCFLLSGNDRLSGRRPIDELLTGNVSGVVAAAMMYCEHGAA